MGKIWRIASNWNWDKIREYAQTMDLEEVSIEQSLWVLEQASSLVKPPELVVATPEITVLTWYPNPNQVRDHTEMKIHLEDQGPKGSVYEFEPHAVFPELKHRAVGATDTLALLVTQLIHPDLIARPGNLVYTVTGCNDAES